MPTLTPAAPPRSEPRKMASPFERYLTAWVGLCILGGILLGKAAPQLARALDGMALYVDGAPVVSIDSRCRARHGGFGVLMELPVMLMLVEFKRTAHWFPPAQSA